ncbi:MAG: DUF1905 domain-containing protein [Phycisphaerae bacterium]|nr:DUF1905 domain-containing protein [Phycisphaerae bacterium]
MGKTRQRTGRAFIGELTSQGPGGAWTFMRIPFDSAAEFGTKGRVPVILAVGGTEFRTSIFPSGDGGHHMMFNKVMCSAAGAKPGGSVRCTIRADVEERTVEVPHELKTALTKSKTAKAAFEACSWSCKKEYCEYVAEAKKEETRAKRAAKVLELVVEKKRVK